MMFKLVYVPSSLIHPPVESSPSIDGISAAQGLAHCPGDLPSRAA